MKRARAQLAAVSVLVVSSLAVSTGCSGSRHSSGSSIPVQTVSPPTQTETLENRGSSMEPTLHCARPGEGCLAVANDRILVREPVDEPRRGDVIAFRTPTAATEAACNASGVFVKR